MCSSCWSSSAGQEDAEGFEGVVGTGAPQFRGHAGVPVVDLLGGHLGDAGPYQEARLGLRIGATEARVRARRAPRSSVRLTRPPAGR